MSKQPTHVLRTVSTAYLVNFGDDDLRMVNDLIIETGGAFGCEAYDEDKHTWAFVLVVSRYVTAIEALHV